MFVCSIFFFFFKVLSAKIMRLSQGLMTGTCTRYFKTELWIVIFQDEYTIMMKWYDNTEREDFTQYI